MNDIRKTIVNADNDNKKKKESENNSKKQKFTVLDFFLVVVLLLCIVGVGFRSTIADFFLRAEPTEKVTISFKAASTNLSRAEKAVFEKGNEVFFENDRNHAFGAITDIVKDGVQVGGKIEMDARYTEEGLASKDGRLIRVGETFNICIGNCVVCVQITEIPRK